MPNASQDRRDPAQVQLVDGDADNAELPEKREENSLVGHRWVVWVRSRAGRDDGVEEKGGCDSAGKRRERCTRDFCSVVSRSCGKMGLR